jgi:predicted enzyme related to lactoylglutathione lyase
MTQPVDNQVVWFDIPVRDLDRAIRFYSAVLAAPLNREAAGPGMDLAVLSHAENTVGGCLVQKTGDEPGRQGPLIYLNAKGRLDDAIAAAGKHGGKVLEPKHSIAPHGFRAVILDSEGNRIALHSM